MNSRTAARTMRLSRLTAGTSLVALALVAPLSACGSSSSTVSSATSAAASVLPSDSTTPMDSTSPMDSSSPMDSAPAGDTGSATPDATASTTPSATASTPAASSAPAAGGSFTGKKDATVVTRLVPVASMKFASVKFPKTLGGMPMLGDLDGGPASRYASYTKLDNPFTVTTTVAKNSDANDTDVVANKMQGAASYDGGRIKCGMDNASESHTCFVRIAGNDDFVTTTPSKVSNDVLVKYVVEFLNHQK